MFLVARLVLVCANAAWLLRFPVGWYNIGFLLFVCLRVLGGRVWRFFGGL